MNSAEKYQPTSTQTCFPVAFTGIDRRSFEVEKGFEDEVWRDIPEHEGYQASNLGRVRSVTRMIKTKKGAYSIKGCLLTPSKNKFGYLRVRVKNRTLLVHRLVLAAFEGISKLQVDHLNEIKHDNRRVNLEYKNNRKNVSKSFLLSKTTDLPTGVFYCNSRYRVHMWVYDKHEHIGMFNTVEEASTVYKKIEKFIEEGKPKDFILENCKVKYTGKTLPLNVYRSRKNTFNCKFYHNGKHYYVGSYPTVELAEKAVIEKRKELGIL